MTYSLPYFAGKDYYFLSQTAGFGPFYRLSSLYVQISRSRRPVLGFFTGFHLCMSKFLAPDSSFWAFSQAFASVCPIFSLQCGSFWILYKLFLLYIQLPGLHILKQRQKTPGLSNSPEVIRIQNNLLYYFTFTLSSSPSTSNVQSGASPSTVTSILFPLRFAFTTVFTFPFISVTQVSASIPSSGR